MARKQISLRTKSQVVGVELRMGRKTVFVYVRRRSRRGNNFDWRVYQRATLSTIRRIAATAEQLVAGSAPLCTRCQQNPVYRRAGCEYALCAACALEALHEVLAFVPTDEEVTNG